VFKGTVENDSDEGTPTPLKNVQVTDTHDGITSAPLLLKKGGVGSGATSVSLEPGEFATYESTYVPSSMGDSCPSSALNSYSDTVTATGDSVIGGTPPIDTMPDDCAVCVDCALTP
jgi:hypothetical protein